MPSYDEVKTADRRLMILQLLQQERDYRLNDREMQMMLKQTGNDTSCDALRNELNWLAEQDLVDVYALESLKVATLKQRGSDAATGLSVIDGVARPRPAL